MAHSSGPPCSSMPVAPKDCSGHSLSPPRTRWPVSRAANSHHDLPAIAVDDFVPDHANVSGLCLEITAHLAAGLPTSRRDWKIIITSDTMFLKNCGHPCSATSLSSWKPYFLSQRLLSTRSSRLSRGSIVTMTYPRRPSDGNHTPSHDFRQATSVPYARRFSSSST